MRKENCEDCEQLKRNFQETLDSLQERLESCCAFCKNKKDPQSLVVDRFLEPILDPMKGPFGTKYPIAICEQCTVLVAEIFKERTEANNDPQDHKIIPFPTQK